MSRSGALSSGSSGSALKVADLVETWHMGHRGGGSYRQPENTRESFERFAQLVNGQARGRLVLDGGDIRKLADGALASMHATTVDATTNGTGAVTKYSLLAYRRLKADVSAWATPFTGWADETPATWYDVLDVAKRHGVVFTPEQKDQGDAAVTAQMVADLKRYGVQDQAIFQSFNPADCQAAKAAGLKVCRIGSGSAPSVASLLADQVDFLSYDILTPVVFTAAYLQSVYDAGIKLFPYTFARRKEITDELARVGRPFAGVVSEDPIWTSGLLAAMTSDPFETQTWWPGTVPQRAGVFRAPNKWGFNQNGYALQGWGSQDAAQASIQFTLTLENNVATATRWVGIGFFAPDDRQFDSSNVAGRAGYRLLIRQSGAIELYRVTDTVALQLGATLSTAAIGVGGSAQIKISRPTGNDIKIERLDTAQSFTVTDATYRGGYFSFIQSDGGDGLQSSLSAVTVT